MFPSFLAVADVVTFVWLHVQAIIEWGGHYFLSRPPSTGRWVCRIPANDMSREAYIFPIWSRHAKCETTNIYWRVGITEFCHEEYNWRTLGQCHFDGWWSLPADVARNFLCFCHSTVGLKPCHGVNEEGPGVSKGWRLLISYFKYVLGVSHIGRPKLMDIAYRLRLCAIRVELFDNEQCGVM
jgi:hypothetical protein